MGVSTVHGSWCMKLLGASHTHDSRCFVFWFVVIFLRTRASSKLDAFGEKVLIFIESEYKRV